jgi:hypothetical protein
LHALIRLSAEEGSRATEDAQRERDEILERLGIPEVLPIPTGTPEG